VLGDTPASTEIPTQDDPHGAGKDKRRTKNFNVDEILAKRLN
jgi:hypothetical protein